MTFAELQTRLVEHLRTKLRSGEVSERGLARQLGVSQPHLHHVLAGNRVLSPQRSDEILLQLGLDLLSLAAPPGTRVGEFRLVPVGRGGLGPYEDAPALLPPAGQIPLRREVWEACALQAPMFLRIGEDPELGWGTGKQALALVETAPDALLPVQETAWYAVRYDGRWLLRRVRWQPPHLVLQGQLPLLGSPIPPILTPEEGDVCTVLAGILVWAGPDPRVAIEP